MFLCFEWTLFLILSAHCNEIQFLVVPTGSNKDNLSTISNPHNEITNQSNSAHAISQFKAVGKMFMAGTIQIEVNGLSVMVMVTITILITMSVYSLARWKDWTQQLEGTESQVRSEQDQAVPTPPTPTTRPTESPPTMTPQPRPRTATRSRPPTLRPTTEEETDQPPKATGVSRARPRMIVRAPGLQPQECPHLWTLKAKNSHGFNVDCLRCGQKQYQPWSNFEKLQNIRDLRPVHNGVLQSPMLH